MPDEATEEGVTPKPEPATLEESPLPVPEPAGVDEPAQPTPEPAKTEEGPRRTPWRENIEAMAMAVIMALLLKYFIVEAYKIPTGSMQPTLIGDEETEFFDRILVDKLSYTFRDPKRWEVVVFRYPLDRSKTFVKRIAGIGPEELKIDKGDIWHRRDSTEEWRIARRPDSVVDETWKELPPNGDQPHWKVEDGGADWETVGKSVRARGDGRARFRPRMGAILDKYLDGYPEGLIGHIRSKPGTGNMPVGDLRVAGDVTALEETRAVLIDLEEGRRLYRFRIPGPAASDEARPAIEILTQASDAFGVTEREVATDAFRLTAGATVDVSVHNLDDQLELWIDGEMLARFDVEATADQRSAAYLGVEGEGADFAGMTVYRDIYYTASTAKQNPITIPDGYYYMLGDNTQDSSDSREWSFTRYRVAPEDGEPTEIRGNTRDRENPVTFGYGEEGGATVRFRDEWGELHWFKYGDSERLSPEEAPFVPRDKILGRALAVFWPLNFRLGVYRLQWVN